MMQMTPLAKKALILHVGYFVGCVLYFEKIPIPAVDPSPGFDPSPRVFLVTMFVYLLLPMFAYQYLLMSMQNVVPRWTWLIPLFQMSSNLSNSFILIFFSPVGKEIGKSIELIQNLDTVLIAGLLITYVYTFFTASVVGGYKQQQQ